MSRLINISELTRLLNNDQDNNKKTSNHTLRYWEKEFSQIKPKIIKKRRYYDTNQIEIIKMIRFLLKDKELTIKGVKKVLNSNFKQLDGYKSYGLKADYFKDKIKIKSKKVLERLNKLKKNGKKNTY
tara:strand:- start:6338 stop:6718 length:381 start_codon:yes stop_codon:yes gene_type:complete